MMTRTRAAVSFAVLVPVFAAVAWIAVMLNDTVPPYNHDYGIITADPPGDPRENSQVTVTWVMKEPPARLCEGFVQREIWIGTGASVSLACLYDKQPAIRREQLHSTRGDGRPDSLDRSFQLCPKATAGPARYRALTCYYCNPLQRATGRGICLYTPDIPFQIRSSL